MSANTEWKVSVSDIMIQLLKAGVLKAPVGMTLAAAETILRDLAPTIDANSATVVTTSNFKSYSLKDDTQDVIKLMLTDTTAYPAATNYVVYEILAADVVADVASALSIVAQKGFRGTSSTGTTINASQMVLGYKLRSFTRRGDSTIPMNYTYGSGAKTLYGTVNISVSKPDLGGVCLISFTGRNMTVRDSAGEGQPIVGFKVRNCAGRAVGYVVVTSGNTYAYVSLRLPTGGARRGAEPINIETFLVSSYNVDTLSIDQVEDLRRQM